MPEQRPITQAEVRSRPLEVVLDLLSGSAQPSQVSFLDARGRRRLARQLAPVDRWHRVGWITGFGLGPKIVKGLLTAEPACRVYVRSKRPTARLRRSERIPTSIELEGFEAPVLLDVVENPLAQLSGLTQPYRPVFPGISAGNCRTGQTGSLGLLCGLAGHPGRFLLGASHVLAMSGLAKKGDPIIQPGHGHGGTCPSFSIGKLHDWVPLQATSQFVNCADAALAEAATGLAENLEIFPITGFATPADVPPGTLIRKLGAITLVQPGMVSELHHRCHFQHPVAGARTESLGFRDLIRYQATADSGDSGGPLVTVDHKLVGIHMGTCGSAAIATPIWNLLSHWQLTL